MEGRSTVDRNRLGLVASCTLASGATTAVGIVALGAMFAAFGAGNQRAGQAFGLVNDVLAIPSLLLMVPAVVALRQLVRPTAPRLCDAITAVALFSTAGVIVLQGLLVLRALSFEQEVGPVMLVYLGLTSWYVIIGHLGSRSGLLPRGTRMGALAATYVGYPVWAVWLARTLRALASASPSTRVAAAAEH